MHDTMGIVIVNTDWISYWSQKCR